ERVCGALWLGAGRCCSVVVCFFFFFSSRRRHTRLVSDWSSDVCSSDLADWQAQPHRLRRGRRSGRLRLLGRDHREPHRQCGRGQIGRASCRGRGGEAGGGGGLEKKKREVGGGRGVGEDG